MGDTDPRLDDAGDPNLRMDAYYYSFERTGVGVIDAILSAVATAGKAYHNTSEWAEGWSDEDSGDTSHAARIQAAADEAARRIRVDSEQWQADWDTAAEQAAIAIIELRAENERLRTLIDPDGAGPVSLPWQAMAANPVVSELNSPTRKG